MAKQYNPQAYENWRAGYDLDLKNHKPYSDKYNPYTNRKPSEALPEEESLPWWSARATNAPGDIKTVSSTIQKAKAQWAAKPDLHFEYGSPSDFTPERVGAGLGKGTLVNQGNKLFRTFTDSKGRKQVESLPIAQIHENGSIKPMVYSNLLHGQLTFNGRDFDKEARKSQKEYAQDRRDADKFAQQNIGENAGVGSSAFKDMGSSIFGGITSLYRDVRNVTDNDRTHAGEVENNRLAPNENFAFRTIGDIAGNIIPMVATGGAIGIGTKAATKVPKLAGIAAKVGPGTVNALTALVHSGLSNTAEYAQGDATPLTAIGKTAIDVISGGVSGKLGAKSAEAVANTVNSTIKKKLPKVAKEVAKATAVQSGIGLAQGIGDMMVDRADNAAPREALKQAGFDMGEEPGLIESMRDQALPTIGTTLAFELFGAGKLLGKNYRNFHPIRDAKLGAATAEMRADPNNPISDIEVSSNLDNFVNDIVEAKKGKPLSPLEIETAVRKAKKTGIIDARLTEEDLASQQRYGIEERALRKKLSTTTKADPVAFQNKIVERLEKGYDDDAIIKDMRDADIALIPQDEARARAIIADIKNLQAKYKDGAALYAEAMAQQAQPEQIKQALVESGLADNTTVDKMYLDLTDIYTKDLSPDSIMPEFYADGVRATDIKVRATGKTVEKPAEAAVANEPTRMSYLEELEGIPMSPQAKAQFGELDLVNDPYAQANSKPIGMFIKHNANKIQDPIVKRYIRDAYLRDGKANFADASGAVKMLQLYKAFEPTESRAKISTADAMNRVIDGMVGKYKRADFEESPLKYISTVADPLSTSSWKDQVLAEADRKYMLNEILEGLQDKLNLDPMSAAEALAKSMGVNVKDGSKIQADLSKGAAKLTPQEWSDLYKVSTGKPLVEEEAKFTSPDEPEMVTDDSVTPQEPITVEEDVVKREPYKPTWEEKNQSSIESRRLQQDSWVRKLPASEPQEVVEPGQATLPFDEVDAISKNLIEPDGQVKIPFTEEEQRVLDMQALKEKEAQLAAQHKALVQERLAKIKAEEEKIAAEQARLQEEEAARIAAEQAAIENSNKQVEQPADEESASINNNDAGIKSTEETPATPAQEEVVPGEPVDPLANMTPAERIKYYNDLAKAERERLTKAVAEEPTITPKSPTQKKKEEYQQKKKTVRKSAGGITDIISETKPVIEEQKGIQQKTGDPSGDWVDRAEQERLASKAAQGEPAKPLEDYTVPAEPTVDIEVAPKKMRKRKHVEEPSTYLSEQLDNIPDAPKVPDAPMEPHSLLGIDKSPDIPPDARVPKSDETPLADEDIELSEDALDATKGGGLFALLGKEAKRAIELAEKAKGVTPKSKTELKTKTTEKPKKESSKIKKAQEDISEFEKVDDVEEFIDGGITTVDKKLKEADTDKDLVPEVVKVPKEFIKEAEEALLNNPDIPEQDRVRLYNEALERERVRLQRIEDDSVELKNRQRASAGIQETLNDMSKPVSEDDINAEDVARIKAKKTSETKPEPPTWTERTPDGRGLVRASASLDAALSKLVDNVNVKHILDIKLEQTDKGEKFIIQRETALPIDDIVERYESQLLEAGLTENDLDLLQQVPALKRPAHGVALFRDKPKPNAGLSTATKVQAAKMAIGGASMLSSTFISDDDRERQWLKKMLLYGGVALIGADAYGMYGKKLFGKRTGAAVPLPHHKLRTFIWTPKAEVKKTYEAYKAERLRQHPEDAARYSMWEKSNDDFEKGTWSFGRSIAHIEGELPRKLQHAAVDGQIRKNQAMYHIEKLQKDFLNKAREVEELDITKAIGAIAKVNDEIYTKASRLRNDPHLTKEFLKAELEKITVPADIINRLEEVSGKAGTGKKLYEAYQLHRELQNLETWHDVAATLRKDYGIDLENIPKEVERLGQLSKDFMVEIKELRAERSQAKANVKKTDAYKDAYNKRSLKKIASLYSKDGDVIAAEDALAKAISKHKAIKNKMKAFSSALEQIEMSKATHHLQERWAHARTNSTHAFSAYEISSPEEGGKRIHENSTTVNKLIHFNSDEARTRYANDWMAEVGAKPVEGYSNIYQLDNGKYVQINDKVNFEKDAYNYMPNLQQTKRVIMKLVRDDLDFNSKRNAIRREIEALRNDMNIVGNADSDMSDNSRRQIEDIDTILNVLDEHIDEKTLASELTNLFTYQLEPRARRWHKNKNAEGYAPVDDSLEEWATLLSVGNNTVKSRIAGNYLNADINREIERQLLEANTLGVHNSYTDFLDKTYSDIAYQGNAQDEWAKKMGKYGKIGMRAVYFSDAFLSASAIVGNGATVVKNVTSGITTNIAGMVSKGYKSGQMAASTKGIMPALKETMGQDIYKDPLLNDIHDAIIEARIPEATSISQLEKAKDETSWLYKTEEALYAGMKWTEVVNRYTGAMGFVLNAVQDTPLSASGLSREEYIKALVRDASIFVSKTQGNYDFIFRTPVERFLLRHVPLGKVFLTLQSPAINQLNFFANTVKKVIAAPDKRKQEGAALLAVVGLSFFAGGVENVPLLGDALEAFDFVNYDKNDKDSQKAVVQIENTIIDAMTAGGVSNKTARHMANIYRKGFISFVFDKDLSMKQTASDMLTPLIIQKMAQNIDDLKEVATKRDMESLLNLVAKNVTLGNRLIRGFKQKYEGEALDSKGSPLGRKYGWLDFAKTVAFGDDLEDKIAREDKFMGARGIRSPQDGRKFFKDLLNDDLTYDGEKGSDAQEAIAEALKNVDITEEASNYERQLSTYRRSGVMKDLVERNIKRATSFIEKNKSLLKQMRGGEYAGVNDDYTSLEKSISDDVKRYVNMLAKKEIAKRVSRKFGLGEIELASYDGKYDLSEWFPGEKSLEDYPPSQQPFVFAVVRLMNKAKKTGVVDDESEVNVNLNNWDGE